MKLKYFMRGLGIGIIFGAIVMLVAAGTSDKEKLSDEEIKNRAKALGMIEATSTDAESDNSELALDSVSTEEITEADEIIKTEEVTEEISTAEETVTSEDSKETTEEIKETTETTTEDKKETTTEPKKETTTEKTDNSYTEATITVTRGMGSTEVAKLLQEAGVIEDADDFDSYLVKNGISNKIQINTYKFNSNMTYEEIATGLTTPKNN